MTNSKKLKTNLLFKKKHGDQDIVEKQKTTVEEKYTVEDIVLDILFPVFETLELEESKETTAEASILDELIIHQISQVIDDEKTKLYTLEDELIFLTKEKDKAVLTKEISKIKKELDEIEARLKSIIDRLEQIDNLNFRSFDDFNDINLELDETQLLLIKGDIKGINVNRLKDYISLIERLVSVQNNQIDLKEEVEEKEENFELRDQMADTLEDDLKSSEADIKEIDLLKTDLEKLLDKINLSVNKPVEIEEKIIQYSKIVVDTNKIIEALLLFQVGRANSPSLLGISLKAGALIKLSKVLSKQTVTEHKTKVSMENLDKTFKSGKEKLGDASSALDTALTSIEDIKDIFDNYCKEYSSEIKEYQNLFRNILKLEADLIKEKLKVNEFHKTLSSQEKQYSKKVNDYEKKAEAA